MTCDVHFRTGTRDVVPVNMCVEFRASQLRNGVCRTMTPFEDV